MANTYGEIDHDYTDEITCPWCGYEFGDSWEIKSDSEDLGLIECYKCDKEFYATRNIEVTCSTRKATYGECRKCYKKDVVIENYWSSLGKYKGLCIECGKKEKERLTREYIAKLVGDK